MIQYIVAIGVLVGLSNAFAEERLVWPQSDAFYKGQVEQKYRTVEQPAATVQNISPVSPSVAYAPQPGYPAPYYGQYPNYAGMGGYYPAVPANPMGYAPNYNMPSGGNGLPFGMNNMNGFMPPVPTNFSFPNPTNAVNGFNFPGFPSFGNNMFNPFGR